jgi:predicted nucleic acid-binding protein
MPAAERGGPNPVYFLDTNVLVYAYSAQNAAKREIGRALVEADRVWVSTQVLSELANALTRRFGVPVPEARQRVASIAAACDVVVVSPSIVLDAFRLMDQWGYGFSDSQIISAALACGASVLYSEDLRDGQTVDGRLAIRSPFRLRAEQRAKPYRVGKRRAKTAAPLRRAPL